MWVGWRSLCAGMNSCVQNYVLCRAGMSAGMCRAGMCIDWGSEEVDSEEGTVGEGPTIYGWQEDLYLMSSSSGPAQTLNWDVQGCVELGLRTRDELEGWRTVCAEMKGFGYSLLMALLVHLWHFLWLFYFSGPYESHKASVNSLFSLWLKVVLCGFFCFWGSYEKPLVLPCGVFFYFIYMALADDLCLSVGYLELYTIFLDGNLCDTLTCWLIFLLHTVMLNLLTYLFF